MTQHKPLLGAALLLAIVLPAAAHAAQVTHAFDEDNSGQTTTSTTPVDFSPALEIGSGSFTAGSKYWILFSAQISNNTAAEDTEVQLLHGSTVFEGSLCNNSSRNANIAHSCGFSYVWTAVSGEAVKAQFRIVSAGTGKADHLALSAIKIDELTEGTDWAFDDHTTDTSLTTTYSDGGNVTFTPGASGAWLVITHSQIDATATANFVASRMDRSGEATSSVPSAAWRIRDATNGITHFTFSRVFDLTAASNTFKEQSACESGTNHTRLYSSVFALRLAAFTAATGSEGWTEADTNLLSVSSYDTQLETATVTPTVTSDVLAGTSWTCDYNSTSRECEFRLQADNADQPSGQTTSNYQYDEGAASADEIPLWLVTVKNQTNAAHAWDLDASADSATSLPAGQHAMVWAVSLELAAAGAAPTPRRTLLGVGR